MSAVVRAAAFALALWSCSGEEVALERYVLPGSGNVASGEAVCPEGWLRYEPAVVALVGRLATVNRLGPPNFGESPDVDEHLTVPVLILQEPVSVCADSGSALNNEMMVNVDSVQVVGGDNIGRLTGRSVVVEGHLSRAVTGRHFFLLIVSAVSVKER